MTEQETQDALRLETKHEAMESKDVDESQEDVAMLSPPPSGSASSAGDINKQRLHEHEMDSSQPSPLAASAQQQHNHLHQQLPLSLSKHAESLFSSAKPLSAVFNQRMVGYPWATPAHYFGRFEGAGSGSRTLPSATAAPLLPGSGSGESSSSGASAAAAASGHSTMSLSDGFGAPTAGAMSTSLPAPTTAAAGSGASSAAAGSSSNYNLMSSLLGGIVRQSLQPLQAPFLCHYKAKDQPPYFLAICQFQAKKTLTKSNPDRTQQNKERKRAAVKNPSFYVSNKVIMLGPEPKVPIFMHEHFIHENQISVADRHLLLHLWIDEAVPENQKFHRESAMMGYYWGPEGKIRQTGHLNSVNNMLYVSGKMREAGSSTFVHQNRIDHKPLILYKQSVKNLVAPAPNLEDPTVMARAMELLAKFGLMSAFAAAKEKATAINLSNPAKPRRVKWPSKSSVLEGKSAPGVTGAVAVKRLRNGKTKGSNATDDVDSDEQSSDSDGQADEDEEQQDNDDEKHKEQERKQRQEKKRTAAAVAAAARSKDSEQEDNSDLLEDDQGPRKRSRTSLVQSKSTRRQRTSSQEEDDADNDVEMTAVVNAGAGADAVEMVSSAGGVPSRRKTAPTQQDGVEQSDFSFLEGNGVDAHGAATGVSDFTFARAGVVVVGVPH
jgi:hypothetical protein